MLKMIFMISGFLFVLSIIIHKLYVSRMKDMMKASHFVASMAVFMGIYILSGIVLAIFIPQIINKIFILLFALSPFIIGKFATYEKEKFYSLVQIICVLISIVFVFIRG